MGHADRHGAFRLSRIHGDDAAAHALGHIGPGVYGDHQDRGQPYGRESDRVVGEIGESVVEEYGLQHHGCAAEHLHVDANDHADEPQNEALERVVALRIGDRVEHAADKADQTPDQGADKGQKQRVAHTGDIRSAVSSPQLGDIRSELSQFVHDLSENISNQREKNLPLIWSMIKNMSGVRPENVFPAYPSLMG